MGEVDAYMEALLSQQHGDSTCVTLTLRAWFTATGVVMLVGGMVSYYAHHVSWHTEPRVYAGRCQSFLRAFQYQSRHSCSTAYCLVQDCFMTDTFGYTAEVSQR